jgi:hypothetical protein
MSRTERMTELEERLIVGAEADLQRLLSIEPSPEFAAKVRARIGDQKNESVVRWRFLALALGAAAAVVLVVALVENGPFRTPPPPSIAARQPDIVLNPESKPAIVNVPAVANVPAVPPRHDAVSQIRQAVSAREPEIIIDPAMTAAIQRLAAAARNTILDGSNGESIAADANAGALSIAEPLKVPELVLSPADPNGGQ